MAASQQRRKLLAGFPARSFTKLPSLSSNGILIAEVNAHFHPFCATGLPDVQDPDRYTKARERHTRPAEVTDVGIRREPVALRIVEERIPFQAAKTTLDTLPVQADSVRLL